MQHNLNDEEEQKEKRRKLIGHIRCKLSIDEIEAVHKIRNKLNVTNSFNNNKYGFVKELGPKGFIPITHEDHKFQNDLSKIFPRKEYQDVIKYIITEYVPKNIHQEIMDMDQKMIDLQEENKQKEERIAYLEQKYTVLESSFKTLQNNIQTYIEKMNINTKNCEKHEENKMNEEHIKNLKDKIDSLEKIITMDHTANKQPIKATNDYKIVTYISTNNNEVVSIRQSVEKEKNYVDKKNNEHETDVLHKCNEDNLISSSSYHIPDTDDHIPDTREDMGDTNCTVNEKEVPQTEKYMNSDEKIHENDNASTLLKNFLKLYKCEKDIDVLYNIMNENGSIFLFDPMTSMIDIDRAFERAKNISGYSLELKSFVRSYYYFLIYKKSLLFDDKKRKNDLKAWLEKNHFTVFDMEPKKTLSCWSTIQRYIMIGYIISIFPLFSIFQESMVSIIKKITKKRMEPFAKKLAEKNPWIFHHKMFQCFRY